MLSRRWLPTFLAFLILLVALVWAINPWLTWNWISDPRGPDRSQLSIGLSGGAIQFSHFRSGPIRPPRDLGDTSPSFGELYFDTHPGMTTWRPYIGKWTSGPVVCRYWVIPLWLLLLPLGSALFWLHRRRPNPLICLKCGYSLRGITSMRCPECGHPRESIQPRSA